MSEVIVVALITGAVSLAGSFMSMVVAARKSKQQSDLTIYRIDQLEKKVSLHNGYVERTYKLEQSDAIHGEQIRVANHRIADLEAAVSRGKE